MTNETPIDYDRISGVMFPLAMEAEARVRGGVRFVHYTSAQSALDILKSKCMWMRNATCMNDYNEMRHGLSCVIAAFKTDAGRAFLDALEACHEGIAQELDTRFTEIAPGLIEHTYIACVSEHADDEELYGRLSMWRSYGNNTGVALVFDNGPFIRTSDAIPIWVTPVAYIDAQGVEGQVRKIAEGMAENKALLASIPRDLMLNIALRTLIFAVVGSKHVGFKEEREWRVVHFPTIWPAAADRLVLDHVSLGGVPQPIFKIPFVDYPEEGFYGATIPDLIQRVIVGPTQYPVAIRTALAQVMGQAGMEQPIERVHCSDVTLRVQ